MQRSFVARPFLFLTVFMTAGIWLEYLLHFPSIILLSLFALLMIIFFIFRHSLLSKLILCGLFLFLGAINFKIWKENNADNLLDQILPLDSVNVTGCIIEPPDQTRHYGIIDVKSIGRNDYRFSIKRRFLLKLDEDFPWSLLPGDSIYLDQVSVRHVPGKRNPGQFDYQNYLLYRGIIGQIEMQSFSLVRIRKNQDVICTKRDLYSAREHLNQRIKIIYQDNTAAFLSAIFLGKKENISRDIKTDFQKSGVAHILAISGLHVGFVVYIIYLILSFFPVSYRWHNLLTIFLLIVYMFLTGAQPPVIRATLMVSIYLLGRNLERKPDIYNTLGAAAFLILLIQPQQLFWVSFQFSFTAVFSILFFYQRMQPLENKFLKFIPSGFPLKSILLKIFRLFLVSLAAQLGTLPLMAAYFNQIPLISLLLNLMVIPLVGILIPIGVLSLILSYFSSLISILVGQLLSHLIDVLFWIVHTAAGLPFAYVQLSSPDIVVFVIYLLAISLIFWRSAENITTLKLTLGALLVVLVLWKIAPRSYPPQLIMLDVGQGDAFIVKTPTGKQVLIDAGPVYQDWDSGREVILPAIREFGKLHCEKVIITHAHSDHIGGLFSLLEEIKVDTVYLPEMDISYFWQDSAIKTLMEKDIPLRFLKTGDQMVVDQYSRIFILAPLSPYIHGAHSYGYNINDVSVVARFQLGESAILFTGDAETPVEYDLGCWSPLLKADILKVGHHGSITSSSREFLGAVDPDIALISVGQSNKYDHPSEIVIDRLERAGIEYFRTDRNRAVWLKWSGRNWQQVQW